MAFKPWLTSHPCASLLPTLLFKLGLSEAANRVKAAHAGAALIQFCCLNATARRPGRPARMDRGWVRASCL